MTTELRKWLRRAARWTAAGCFALGGAVGTCLAADTPAVSIMLRYKPTQDGVVYTTPKPGKEKGVRNIFCRICS